MNNCTKCSNGTYKGDAGDGPCTNCSNPETQTTLGEGSVNASQCGEAYFENSSGISILPSPADYV